MNDAKMEKTPKLSKLQNYSVKLWFVSVVSSRGLFLCNCIPNKDNVRLNLTFFETFSHNSFTASCVDVRKCVDDKTTVWKRDIFPGRISPQKFYRRLFCSATRHEGQEITVTKPFFRSVFQKISLKSCSDVKRTLQHITVKNFCGSPRRVFQKNFKRNCSAEWHVS